MDISSVDRALGAVFPEERVQGGFTRDWEQDVFDNALRLFSRGFGQFVEQGGFAVDPLQVAQESLDHLVLRAHTDAVNDQHQ